ncbi:MAG: histidine phosphatase family protein [Gammaproteobacteria bacterium]|nr:histidine phosphatase family protein [Gammaproteobacteria bacterium]
MSDLHVVRHGQARLFTDDYDRLSDLGISQAEALGRHWLGQGLEPDAVWCGSLKRQRHTAEAVGQVFVDNGKHWPAPQELDGFNEYPAEDILDGLLPYLKARREDIAAMATALETASDRNDRYRAIHNLLEAVVAAWVRGEYEDGLVPVSWPVFSDGVRQAFQQATRNTASGSTVAIFTSGGPIGIGMQTVMAAPDIKAAELHWRVHNCSVTRFTFSGRRISLDRFNDISHLPADMHTYR